MWRFCRGFDHRNSRQNEWHIFKLQNDIFTSWFIWYCLHLSLDPHLFLGKSCRLRLGQNLRASRTTETCLKKKKQHLPSGKHTKNYGKSQFLKGKLTISMAIFNSYVKLPEGTIHFLRRRLVCPRKTAVHIPVARLQGGRSLIGFSQFRSQLVQVLIDGMVTIPSWVLNWDGNHKLRRFMVFPCFRTGIVYSCLLLVLQHYWYPRIGSNTSEK